MQRIGVFTSGGDSPGMNACIRAIVRSACHRGIEVIGIRRGYQGMIEGDMYLMKQGDVSNIIQYGGTILKTARSKEFMTADGRKKAYSNLIEKGIEGVICLGGNGSYTGAKQFYQEYKLPFIGIPCTIDNDLYGTDFTIGYDTAVNNALSAIDKIRDTADAHNRIFFIEVMGRDSGFIALSAGLAGGAEGILLPEVLHDFEALEKHFENKGRRKKVFSIVVVAEGETEGHTYDLANKFKNKFPDLDIKVSVLGHIQRGGSPTASDRILASILGYNALEALLDGKANLCVGIIDKRVTYTSFEEAIIGKKTIDKNWLSMAQILSC